MGLVDSVGALAASIIAAIIFLIFAIVSLFVTAVTARKPTSSLVGS